MNRVDRFHRILLRLGRDGERAVAEQLDDAKRQSAIIFHDLIAEGFNLDHVVLSRQGIFAVETKTHTKPAQGSPSVSFDGENLLVNGYKPDLNPITQAQANAKWLTEMLRSSTNQACAKKAVEQLRRPAPIRLLVQKHQQRINELIAKFP